MGWLSHFHALGASLPCCPDKGGQLSQVPPLMRNRTNSAQSSDIKIDPRGSPDQAHLYGLWWKHGSKDIGIDSCCFRAKDPRMAISVALAGT